MRRRQNQREYLRTPNQRLVRESRVIRPRSIEHQTTSPGKRQYGYLIRSSTAVCSRQAIRRTTHPKRETIISTTVALMGEIFLPFMAPVHTQDLPRTQHGWHHIPLRKDQYLPVRAMQTRDLATQEVGRHVCEYGAGISRCWLSYSSMMLNALLMTRHVKSFMHSAIDAVWNEFRTYMHFISKHHKKKSQSARFPTKLDGSLPVWASAAKQLRDLGVPGELLISMLTTLSPRHTPKSCASHTR